VVKIHSLILLLVSTNSAGRMCCRIISQSRPRTESAGLHARHNTSSSSGGYLAHVSGTGMESGPIAAHAGKMREWRAAAAAVAAPSPDAERWLFAAFAQTSALRREAAALPCGPGVEALHAVLEMLVLRSRAPDVDHACEMAVWMPGMQRRVNTYNAAVFSLRVFDSSLARRYVEEPPALLNARVGASTLLRLDGEPPAVAAFDSALCCAQASTHEPMRYAEPPAVAALDAALCCLRSARANTHKIITLLGQ